MSEPAMHPADRQRLPWLRRGVRMTVRCLQGGNVEDFDVQFNFFPDGRVGECFCRPFKTGSQMEDQLDRFCVVLSIALQSGCRIADIAKTTGDNVPRLVRDGQDEQPDHIFGEIIRAGLFAETAEISTLIALGTVTAAPSPEPAA